MLESARGLTCALTKILLYVPLHHPARSATWCVQSPTLTLTYPFGINPICDLSSTLTLVATRTSTQLRV